MHPLHTSLRLFFNLTVNMTAAIFTHPFLNMHSNLKSNALLRNRLNELFFLTAFWRFESGTRSTQETASLVSRMSAVRDLRHGQVIECVINT